MITYLWTINQVLFINLDEPAGVSLLIEPRVNACPLMPAILLSLILLFFLLKLWRLLPCHSHKFAWTNSFTKHSTLVRPTVFYLEA